MSDLVVSEKLVGQRVRIAARPDWGIGTVLRVQTTRVAGAEQHRVFIQFRHGNRAMIVPPARLSAPTDEPQRSAGWIDQLGNSTLDDALRQLPASVTEHFGSPRERLAEVLPLYDVGDDANELLKWARHQTGVGDPLSQWSRDELVRAFDEFCVERDGHFRNIAALLVQGEGIEALRDVLDGFSERAQREAAAALQKII